MNATFWNILLKINSADTNARLDVQLKKINPIRISTIEVSDRVILYNLNSKKEWISFLKTLN